MISGVVVVLATFAFMSAASSLAARQSDCTFVPVPQECVQATDEFTNRSMQIQANLSSITFQQIREILVPFLNTICGSTCLPPTVSNLKCINQNDLANFTLTALCGKNGNEFCQLLLLDLAKNGINTFPVLTCPDNGTCDTSCRNTLRTIVDRWGCCAASWYTNSFSPFASVGNQYRTCGVSVGKVCAGSTTVHYLSAMLLFAVSALVIFIL